jgi:hypothetical protein
MTDLRSKENPKKSGAKKPYKRPMLSIVGTVSEVTRSGTASGTEGQGVGNIYKRL